MVFKSDARAREGAMVVSLENTDAAHRTVITSRRTKTLANGAKAPGRGTVRGQVDTFDGTVDLDQFVQVPDHIEEDEETTRQVEPEPEIGAAVVPRQHEKRLEDGDVEDHKNCEHVSKIVGK